MTAPSALLLLSLLSAPPAATNPLCTQREPCRVMETRDAGQDEQGRALQVLRLSLGWTDLETGARFAGLKYAQGARKAEAVKKKGWCEATEWWLLRPEKPAQLLLSGCGDGQGAVREEKVAVGDNRIRYTRSGVRRGTKWATTRALTLSPLRFASDNNRSARTSASTGEEREDGEYWDYDALHGEVVRAPSECQPGESSLGERELPYLPQVQVEPAYLQGGWKKAGLGTGEGECHLGANNVLLGQENIRDQQDVLLRALLVAEDTLIIEVRDDTWTGPTSNWIDDDHLDIWLAAMPPQELSGCGEPTEEQKPVQWGIRMVDGKVFPGFGAPQQALQVERTELPGKKGYRLKVKLPIPFGGITVAYSDNDGGKKPESQIATSPLKPGRPETLNPVYWVDSKNATCAVKNGELTVVPRDLQTVPEQAVLQVK